MVMLDDDVVIDEDLEEDIEGEINKDVEKLKNEISELDAKYKRALADYQNLERRSAEQKREWANLASSEVIAKILPALDTLFLAQSHLNDEGLRLSIQKFLGALKDEGVERIKTEGEHFNPNLMEATEVVEGSKDKVVEEVRPGYTMNEKILRVAQVKVGKGK